MLNDKSRINRLLRETVHKEYIVLTGRGTTALYILLNALNQKDKQKIIVPNMICHSVMLAIKYAGYRAICTDIEKESFNIALNDNLPDGIIIVAHLFGYPVNIDLFNTRKENIIIEDVAQSIGGMINGKPLGSFGYTTLLSFGTQKPISVGQGGAIATNDRDLYHELIKENKLLNNCSAYQSRLQHIYKNINYLLEDYYENNKQANFNYYNIVGQICKELFLFHYDEAYNAKLLSALKNMKGLSKSHFTIYNKLKSHFNKFPVILAEYQNEQNCNWFYFSFLFEDFQIKMSFLRYMRKNMIHISTCYLPVDYWDHTIEIHSSKHSKKVARYIVNIHISPCRDKNYLQKLLWLSDHFFLGILGK